MLRERQGRPTDPDRQAAKQRRAAPGRAGGARCSYRDAIEQSNASQDFLRATRRNV
jgi:hypothetical protein